MAIQLNLKKRGGFIFTPSGGVGTLANRFGGSLMPAGATRLFAGTGNTQINAVIRKSFSIATSANLDVDLKSGETDLFTGAAVAFTYVKYFYVEITSPGTSDSLKVGPQNVTNGAQLWFDGVGATMYELVRSSAEHVWGNGAGWPIGASTKVVRFNNPSAGTLTGYIVIAGIA